MPKLEIIGHRGARGHAPENTLLGIETGLALGADGIEFDVQLYRPSGELILLHDETLDRTTNGRGRLDACPLAPLRRLDAGAGERIPTLTEALALLRGRGIAHIELKSWNGTAEAVAAVLTKALAAGATSDEFVVSSFHLPELARFHACLPAIPIAALVAGVPLDLASVAQRMDATALHLGNDFVDLPLVADAKARGLAVRVYTVNEPSTMLDLMRLGVDGLITDFPDRALALRCTASETALEPR